MENLEALSAKLWEIAQSHASLATFTEELEKRFAEHLLAHQRADEQQFEHKSGMTHNIIGAGIGAGIGALVGALGVELIAHIH